MIPEIDAMGYRIINGRENPAPTLGQIIVYFKYKQQNKIIP